MWPREHGTYAYLGFPIVSVLWQGRLTTPALLLTAAAVAAYLCHEPLLVLWGARGERRRRERGPEARRWLAASVLTAAGLGVAGLALGGRLVAFGAALPLAAAGVATLAARRGAERSLAGELVALAALVGAALPVGIAAARPPLAVAAVCGVWLASFTVSTLAVRAIARRRFDGGRASRLAFVAVAAMTAALAVSATPTWVVAALCPALLAALVLLARPPSPRHLRRVGWSLVASSVATLTLLLILVP